MRTTMIKAAGTAATLALSVSLALTACSVTEQAQHDTGDAFAVGSTGGNVDLLTETATTVSGSGGSLAEGAHFIQVVAGD